MDDPLAASWAQTEFGAAQLGNKSRTRRLVDLADTLAKAPAAALPQATTDHAQLQAAYRFFDNEHFHTAAVLASHVAATTARCSELALVLSTQDSSLFDYTTHPSTTGLGPLAHTSRRGLVVHTTMAFDEHGVPIGMLDQLIWARDEDEIGKADKRKQLPIEEKESYKWLQSVQAVNKAAPACPNTRFVSVGDREADVYDLFMMAREPNVDLLVRASWDRKTLGQEGKLWATALAANEQSSSTLAIGRRGEQPPRTARLTLRWCPVKLAPPSHRYKEKLPAVQLWLVHALEEQPPAGIEAVEWLLLTTVAVTDALDAEQRLEWYARRWGIEVFHKVLKSGCRIEARQLASAERLTRAMVVYSVVAWRIMVATMLARSVPDVPCTAILEVEEWQALYLATHQTTVLPERTPRLGEAVGWIAKLGGHQGRKSDGAAGVTVMWRGFQRLNDLTIMYRIMRPKPLKT